MKIDTKELTIPKQQATKALGAANSLRITTPEEMNEGTQLLGKIKSAQKIVAAKKKTILGPINKAVKEVRSLFKPIEDNVSEAEKLVKGKMITYDNEAERVQREKEKKISDRVEKGTMRFDTAQKKMEEVEKSEPTVKTKDGAAQFRIHPKAVITDESKLPREYLIPNKTLISKDALAGKEIPGVEVVKEKIVAGYTATTKDDIIERSE